MIIVLMEQVKLVTQKIYILYLWKRFVKPKIWMLCFTIITLKQKLVLDG